MEDNGQDQQQAINRAWCKLMVTTIILLAAFLVPILTLAMEWQSRGTDLPNSFSRSGAITSVFALVAGLRLTFARTVENMLAVITPALQVNHSADPCGAS
ncbi:hypothetical protein [Castellaniella sp.]|uniref:hypothetical protein n=1 Tax=Castellaniella sp. TaxID=1955812 RepID=UPI003C781C49